MMTTDRSGLIIGVVFTSLVLISVTIAGRLMVRKMMAPNRFFLDDALVLVASILTLGLCMVSLAGKRSFLVFPALAFGSLLLKGLRNTTRAGPA